MICAHFHWSFEYVLWGISWINIQMMLADAPWYETKSAKGGTKVKEVVSLDDEDALRNFIKKKTDEQQQRST